MAWTRHLANDVDSVFLLDGILNGFRVTTSTPFKQVRVENYRSATDPSSFSLVEKQIRTEIIEGRYLVVREPPLIISALGAIPKGGGGIRLIHDASRPDGEALNDYAILEGKLKFQSLDDAVNLLRPGCFLAKVDLKSAYRAVRVHPDDWPACGLQWRFSGQAHSTYLMDTCLPFGSRLAPSIFHRLTQAVRRMMARRGFSVIAFLDDFLIVEQTWDRCLLALNTLLSLLRELGFSIAWEKVSGPSQSLIFLGINIDTLAGSLELPGDKLVEFHDLIKSTLALPRISLRQLQVLAGKLNWASAVVRGGRSYLRRVLDLMKPLHASRHKARIPQSMRDDLTWWDQYLHIFNGRSWLHKARGWVHVYVDACNVGGGMAWGNEWAYVHWATDVPLAASAHINVKEALIVSLAVNRWAHLWANCMVVVHSDNITALAGLNKGTSKSPLAMKGLREIFWLSNAYNFTIGGVHIPGVDNAKADAISRLHRPESISRLSDGLGFQSPVFQAIWPLLLRLHMSYGAWLFLFPQFLKWIRASRYWMRKLPDCSPCL